MQKRLQARTRAVYIWLMAPLLGLAVFVGVFATITAPVATAAASSNLNFQARLLNSSGAVVPDGNYNIDFKLYTADSTTGSVGTCAGSCVWEETRKNSNSQGVQVINGYFSVNLGSVTAFGGGINWDQQLWLTMNIGGTSVGASPTWDGEMQNAGHSIALTALPYAFTAGALATGTGASRGTLGFASLGQATAITLPDPGGASATVCYQGSAACNFIQNTTGGPQTANFNIQSAAAGSIGGIINAASGQTADLFELKNSSTVVFGVGNNGQTVHRPTATNDSATFFQVQNAATKAILTVDTASSQLVMGTAGTGGINGKIVFSTTNASNTTISLAAASTAVSYSLILPTTGPALGQCLQNDGTTLGQLTFGACGASGTFLSKNSIDTSSANAGSGYLYGFTNSGSAGTGGVLSLDNGSNTGTVLNVKGSGVAAFQVQNSSSKSVLAVDTTNGQTILGTAGAGGINGALLFQNSTNTNGITIKSTDASSTYSLTLPSAAPAGGLCIETQPGNANQLIFASCTNNNASIQEVHEWDANGTNVIPSVTPTTIGDEMVLTTQIPNAGITVTSVSGGGVSAGAWSKVVTNNGNGTVNRVEMWVGTVASLTTSSITVTYSGIVSGEEVTATEFTAAGVNASTSWGIESSASQLNSTASATVTFPSATAVNGSELYVGYAQVSSPPAISGSSSGFSYIQTSTQHNMITYNTSLAANTVYQPTASQTYPPGTGQSNTVEAVLTAFVTSSSINNTTSLQKANFYVQAASAGTVAGVLQAASTGTADIMELRNGAGTNVLTVGSTGDVLVKGAASATAFQVQNSSNYSVMSVDTSGSQVVLGDATHLSGKITFKNSGDSNTISIIAPTSVAATYSLVLPTNTPTGGLCLGTSPSNANQLIFASCATQVSAASITYINQWSNNGTSVTTLADSPATVGNLLVLYSHATNNVAITGVSGGGVTNWTKVTSNVGAAGQGNDEMWRGVVTTAGSSTITVSSPAAGVNEIVAQEYTMGGTGGGTWAIDTSGTATGSSTTVNYPSLTPANSSELYAGYAWSANTMNIGTTSGYTFTATSGAKYTARNTSVTGGVAAQPTTTQTVSGNYNSIAAVIQAFAGTSVIVNSTAAQQANFNVQAALSGTVAGVLQGASSGSADVLQVKDGSGINVMTVNGSSGVSLSTSNSTGGQLNFIASGNGNIISILTPNSPGASYNLTLPTTTPAPGQCLATSPSNANQLVFSSCANQVTSVAINFVNNWKTSGGVTTNLSVSPASVNNLMVAFISMAKADNVSSISGGGVTTWSKVSGTGSGSGNDTTSIEMWRGVVTSTGASTLSVTVAGPTGTHEVAAMEFTTGSTTGSWVVDSSNVLFNSSSTTMTFPNLTPQSSRDLYVGYGASGSNYSSGGSAGFTYLTGSLANRVGLYNTSVSSTTQPTATTTGSAVSLTVGALVAAYSSSSVISNSTVTQEGNFNIQASTSGSVAGVLQAFGSGTGDVMDILDGAGTLTDSFSSTGNLLVKPSTASAAAFQVQTTGGVNVLSADTSAKQVVVGAGSAGETTPSLLVLDNQTGSAADPATAINGAMYYNATTHEFRCGVASHWQNCSGLVYSNTSTSTINNCSNNCTAFSTAATVPANSCQAGRVINLHASGYFSSLAAAGNVQFGVYYGGDSSVASNDVLIGSLPPAVSVSSASNNYFQLDFTVNCYSTSSMQAEGKLSIQLGAASAGLTSVPLNATSGTTVSTSTDKSLYIFPIWGTASTSNTATITQFNVVSP